jgi:predicted esterase
MQEHHLPVSRTARHFSLGALEGARDVWIVCHGYGQLAARFLERFHALESGHRCVVAPEALSRFYLTENASERRVGASWMTREERLHEIDDYVRYLDALHKAVVPRGAKVTALGFSQGAATVCRWVAMGSAHVDRLIVWGGEIPPDLDLSLDKAAARLRAVQLTLVYGTRDQFFTPKIVAATESRLQEHEIRYELVPFEGGHEIDEATLTAIS